LLTKTSGKESALRPNYVFRYREVAQSSQRVIFTGCCDLRLLGYHQNQRIGLIAD
jgi:hypothetical protein